MGPTPQVATFKLVWNYTSLSLPHKLQCYLDCSSSGDPSGHDAVMRGAFVPTGVSTLVDPMWTVLGPFYHSADTSFGSTVLYQLVTGAWVPLWSATTTVTPSSTPINRAANQNCIAMKTTDNKHLKMFFYEANYIGVGKAISLGALTSPERAIVDYFAGTGVTPLNTDAWAWRVNKGKTYASRWLALVIDYNDKLRRMRGLR